MPNFDPILLVIYILSVIIFLVQIKNAFNDEFTIKFDADHLKQQLQQHGLADKVAVGFSFDKRYEYNKIKQFGIEVKNLSKTASIYIDWDRSIVTDWREVGTSAALKARRICRLNPGTTIDLSQSQIFSTIAPATAFSATITAEDTLQRKGEGKSLPADSPLNLELEVAKPLLTFKAGKQLTLFKEQEIDLEFFVELALRFTGTEWGLSSDRLSLLCRFVMTHLPWTAGLPWNPR